MTTITLPPDPPHGMFLLIRGEKDCVTVKAREEHIVFHEEELDAPLVCKSVFVDHGTSVTFQWHRHLRAWIAYLTPEKQEVVTVTVNPI